jgi:hypothetical protein
MHTCFTGRVFFEHAKNIVEGETRNGAWKRGSHVPVALHQQVVWITYTFLIP